MRRKRWVIINNIYNNPSLPPDANNNNNFTTFTLMLTTITSLPSLTKNPLVTTPVPSTLKVNAPSDIKKQLFII